MVKPRRALLAAHDNDYSALLGRTPAGPKSISVVVPWFNAHRYREFFCSALAAQTDQDFELVLVDDGSVEPMTADPDAWHGVARDVLFVRHAVNHGGAAALNTGCLLASGESVVMFDADMAAPPNLVSDLRRTLAMSDDVCAVGFRGTACLRTDGTLPASVLKDDWRAEILPDDRFEILSAQPKVTRPEGRVYRLLEETRDWRDFGRGRVIGYWDLPVMVVGHTVGVDRTLYLDVGGTPEWCIGWGIRDTALGAGLMVVGAKIVPQTSVISTQVAHTPIVGSREGQLAELNANYRRYQHWLCRPVTQSSMRRRRTSGRHRGVLQVDVGQ
jgi:hypothetical protein